MSPKGPHRFLVYLMPKRKSNTKKTLAMGMNKDYIARYLLKETLGNLDNIEAPKETKNNRVSLENTIINQEIKRKLL